MKIAVFSDSHGDCARMIEAVRGSRPDLIAHLGDYSRDGHELEKKFPHTPVWVVRGNCDSFSMDGDSNIAFCENVKIFMTHGHKYRVKSTLEPLVRAASGACAGIVLFGHTHHAMHEVTGGVHFLNPGACGGYGSLSYAEIEISKDGHVSCDIIPLA